SSLHAIKDLGHEILAALENENYDTFGQLMHSHWQHKQRLSSRITIPGIDDWRPGLWSVVAACITFTTLLSSSQVLLGLGMQRFSLALYYWPTPIVVSAVVIYAWLVRPLPIEAIIWSLPVAWLAGTLVGLAVLLRHVGASTQGAQSASTWHETFAVGLPILGTRTVRYIDTWAPVWLSGWLLSVQDAGVFGAALRLVGGAIAVPQAMGFVSRQTFARAISHEDYAGLRAMMGLLALAVGGPMAIAALIAWLAGGDIMALVFGEPFAVAGTALALLVSGYAFQFLTGSVDLALMMGGRERFLLVINLVSVPVTLLALGIGFHLFGLAGGAAGFALVRMVKFIVFELALRRTFGFMSRPTTALSALRQGAAVFLDRATGSTKARRPDGGDRVD
ncbi:MAG: hypothetical protein AAGD86_12900, partial [Pseudomonadota bacterium]